MVGAVSDRLRVIATEPIIRARLNARPATSGTAAACSACGPTRSWDGDDFDYDGTPVTVVACPSVLAIWEAIEARDRRPVDGGAHQRR